jgi:hypothetical protein
MARVIRLLQVLLLVSGCSGTPAAPSPITSPGPSAPTPASPIQGPGIAALEVAPAVTGGSTLDAVVRLVDPAAAPGMVVVITSSDDAASVPSQVTIAPGQSQASFTISTRAVPQDRAVTITASAGGEPRTATLRLLAIQIDQVTLVQPSLGGGYSTEVLVRLASPAGAEGTAVALSSSTPAVIVPDAIIVAPGSVSALSSLQTQTTRTPLQASVTARSGGQVRTTFLTVWPVFLSFVGQPRDWVTQGQTRDLEPGATHRFFGSHESGQVNIVVRPHDLSTIDEWFLLFRAPRGQALAPGHYVKRHPLDFDGADIIFGGQSRSCGGTGEFSVHDAQFAPDGTILRFRATFSQLCEGNNPAPAPTTGEVWVATLPRF